MWGGGGFVQSDPDTSDEAIPEEEEKELPDDEDGPCAAERVEIRRLRIGFYIWSS